MQPIIIGMLNLVRACRKLANQPSGMFLYRPGRRVRNNYSWIKIGQMGILRDKTSQPTAKLQKTKGEDFTRRMQRPEEKRTGGKEKM